MKPKEYYIEKFKMKRLLTNDYLSQFYVSEDESCSFVYYLLCGNSIFPFHKMTGVSSWQYCDGNPLDVYTIEGQNKIKVTTIGPVGDNNHHFIHITPPHVWFAAVPKVNDIESYTLVVHCIAPGYKAENDIFGFFDDINKIIPEYEALAHGLSCVKGKSSNYLLEPECGYNVNLECITGPGRPTTPEETYDCLSSQHAVKRLMRNLADL